MFSRRASWFQRIYLAHAGEGAADVRDGDGPADDERDVQRVNHFGTVPSFFSAANEMIGDAVIATKNRGRDEAEEFFRLCAECAGFVSLMIESEKALDAEVTAIQDFLIQIGAKFLKIVETVRHDSSESGAAIMRQIWLLAQEARVTSLFCKRN
jgi:hypothetical protein